MRSHARSGLRQDIFLATLSAVALVALLGWIFRPSARAAVLVAQPSGPSLGTISMQIKDVRRRPDGTLLWTDVKRGDNVYDGDGIYVGEGGAAVVSLQTGGHIEIDDKSLVVLRPPRAARDAMGIDLRLGGASGVSEKSPLAIHTLDTNVQLEQGSRASVRVQSDASLAVTVPSGRASIQTNHGNTLVQSMQRRQVTAARVGPAEQLATSLTEPAQSATQYLHTDGQAIAFSWAAAPQARGYTWQLSADSQFRRVVASRPTREPHVTYAGLAEGTYYWRVHVTTKRGSASTEERTLVVVNDRAPVVMEPRDGTTVDLSKDTDLALSWSSVHGVAHYRIDLQNEKTRAVQEFRSRYAGFTLHAAALAEGKYCFRVRCDEHARADSPWSRATCFEVVKRARLRAPKILDPHKTKHPKTGWLWQLVGGVAYADEGRPEAMVLRWEAVEGAAAYLLEIATDPKMTNIVAHERVTGAFFSWQPPDRQDYFWRVRGVDADGREGDPSDVEPVQQVPAAVPIQPLAPVQPPPETHRAPPKAQTAKPAAAKPTAPANPAPVVQHAAPPPTLIAQGSAQPKAARAWVGLRAALFTNWGAIATVQPGAELGAWLTFVPWGPVGVRLNVDYYTSEVNGTSGDALVHASTRLQRVPVSFALVTVWPMSAVQGVAAAGLRWAWTGITTSVSHQPDITSANAEVGAVLSLGLQRALGPGAVFGEFSYNLTTARDDFVDDAPNGLAVAIGYRLGVF